MGSWRAYFLKHQRLAYLLVATAMLVKAIVPQGFMVMPSNSMIMVSLCSGQNPQMVALDLGKGSADLGGGDQENSQASSPCAFSGLHMVAAPGADLALLGLAIAYVLTLGFLPVASRRQSKASRLRPPLRAPPVFG